MTDQPPTGAQANDTVVILFKSPSKDAPDAYESHLVSAAFRPIWVPVLTERFILDRLVEILKEGPERRKGVVMSSKRGAEAWVKAVKGVIHSATSNSDGRPDNSTRSSNALNSHREARRPWSDVPLYAVGSSAVKVLDKAHLSEDWRPGKHKISTAKSANTLLPLLASESLSTPPSTLEDGSDSGYLLLRGDKSLDILSDGLRERGEGVDEVMVYETLPRDDLSVAIESAIAQVEDSGSARVWLAFFAPSSAGMAIPHLGQMLPRRSDSTAQSTIATNRRTEVKVFAIGETTAAFLRHEGVRVDAVAGEPTAEGMILAMQIGS